MFDDWTSDTNESGNTVHRKDHLLAIKLPATAIKGEGASLATSIIYAAGDNFGRDFYSSWNGEAEVKLYEAGDTGILAVMSMGRGGDDYGDDDGYDDDGGGGSSDNPTFAWKKDGDAIWLVASKEWRDQGPCEALGMEWPAREAFADHAQVQGWGE